MSRELLKRAAFVLREVLDDGVDYCGLSVINLQKEIVAYLAQPEPEPLTNEEIKQFLRGENENCN